MEKEISLLECWKGKSKELLHKNVEEILRDYRHSWDILSELLQNSVDAILRKASYLSETDFDPVIEIRIDTKNYIVEVKDNGEGIPVTKLRDVIIPGGTLKKLGKTYGYKGYGLTFLSFISDMIEIETVHDGKKAIIQFEKLFDWVLDPNKENLLIPSQFSKEKAEEVVDERDTYTRVFLKLPIGKFEENFPVLSSLDNFFALVKDKKVLEYILRTRTAVGNVKPILGNDTILPISVNVVLDCEEFKIDSKFLEPTESLYVKSGRVYHIDEYINKILPDPRRHDKSYRSLVAVLKDCEVGSRKKVYFDLKIYVCGRTAMSELAKEYNIVNKQVELGENLDLDLTTGVYLSIDGMPTGIRLDKWEKKGGSWQRYFIIVDVKDKTFSEQLDSGRKGISDYFADKIVNKIVEIITKYKWKDQYTLQKVSRYLQARDTVPTILTPASSVSDTKNRWKQQSKIEFSLKTLEVEPLDEIGVIIIFYELLVKEILKGYKTIFISSQAQYDVGFKYYIPVDDEFKYEEGIKPLGINPLLDEPIDIEIIGEFKIKLEDLVEDFDRSIKRIEDIDLAICWDFNKEKIEDLEALIEPINPFARYLYGSTHYLTYRSKTIEVISLKHLMEIL